LISALQRDKVLNYIKSGKEEGAKLITGGGKWSGSENGYYVQPTILSDVKAEMKVVKEEVSCRLLSNN
jgi:aldehyde dehydrogenase (NAD+)